VFRKVKWLNKLQGRTDGTCIYGGDKTIKIYDMVIKPWDELFG